jgi:CBS-domain-containing membrane protein
MNLSFLSLTISFTHLVLSFASQLFTFFLLLTFLAEGFTSKKIRSVPNTQSTIDAFRELVSAHVSAVAVVDDKGSLVGNLRFDFLSSFNISPFLEIRSTRFYQRNFFIIFDLSNF